MAWIYQVFYATIAEYFWRVYNWRAETISLFSFSSGLCKIRIHLFPTSAQVQVPFLLPEQLQKTEVIFSTSVQIFTLSTALIPHGHLPEA